MRPIGVVGAMDEEVNRLKAMMNVTKIEKKAMMEFFQGNLGGKEIVIVRSGIGKVNAAVGTQILIDDFQVSTVINTGVAGGLRNEINIGDIVISSDTLQHDMDATGFGYDLGVIPRMDQSVFLGDTTLIKKAKEICEKVNPDINTFVGRVVSGDQFISDSEKKKMILENFQGYCTEMEGAAIGQTAFLNQVPFVLIRAISDKADHSAEMDYGEFEAKAIDHTVKLVTNLLEIL